MKYLYTSLILILLVASQTLAEKVTVPEPHNTGDIGIDVVIPESDVYIKEWLSTPPKHGVTVECLKTAKPDQLITAAFLISGMSPDSDGNYSFRVSFALVQPDGKEMFSERNFSIGKGKVPPHPSFIMADPALEMVLEPTDPLGNYTIVGIIEDMVSKKMTTGTYSFRFIKE